MTLEDFLKECKESGYNHLDSHNFIFSNQEGFTSYYKCCNCGYTIHFDDSMDPIRFYKPFTCNEMVIRDIIK